MDIEITWNYDRTGIASVDWSGIDPDGDGPDYGISLTVPFTFTPPELGEPGNPYDGDGAMVYVDETKITFPKAGDWRALIHDFWGMVEERVLIEAALKIDQEYWERDQ